MHSLSVFFIVFQCHSLSNLAQVLSLTFLTQYEFFSHHFPSTCRCPSIISFFLLVFFSGLLSFFLFALHFNIPKVLHSELLLGLSPVAKPRVHFYLYAVIVVRLLFGCHCCVGPFLSIVLFNFASFTDPCFGGCLKLLLIDFVRRISVESRFFFWGFFVFFCLSILAIFVSNTIQPLFFVITAYSRKAGQYDPNGKTQRRLGLLSFWSFHRFFDGKTQSRTMNLCRFSNLLQFKTRPSLSAKQYDFCCSHNHGYLRLTAKNVSYGFVSLLTNNTTHFPSLRYLTVLGQSALALDSSHKPAANHASK